LRTLKIELARHFLQFHDAAEMRGQVLNVSPVEPLTRFDKIQIVLFKLPLLDGSLLGILLAILLNPHKLGRSSRESTTNRASTHPGEQFAEPSIEFQVRIP
jgi:hypothetical protein